MLTFKTPDEKEFQQICNYVDVFELDNRALLRSQFIVAFRNEQLVGFGRLRDHSDCTELCSLGIIPEYRNQLIGKAIANELIKKASQKLYVVCIIPDFFTPLGFQIVNEYPFSIKDKLEYCTCKLVVPETYVVMKFFK